MVKKGTALENPAELIAPLSPDPTGMPPRPRDVEGGTADPPRAAWDSKLQYFFMVISYAVGLGNVWRFPYLTQKHGGGAFLVPYLVMLFVEGMPLLYLEMAIGQKMRLGTMGVWNEIHPLMGGVGIASCVTSYVVAIYYNAIIMWCFFYLFNSFQSPLPWAECPTFVKENVTLVEEECDKSGPTSYYWYRVALDVSSGLEDSGGVKWKMMLCLLFAWLVVYLCICKGIKSSGKVVYFTATFPYIVLLIFFIRGLTLRGATAGLAHMFTPKLAPLADPKVWLDAATQIFYSFGLAFGGLIAFSSYNPRQNNCERDAIIVGLCNWFTAIFACAVIFSILGFKATLMYEHCLDHNIAILVDLYPEWNTSSLTHALYESSFADNITFLQNVTGRDFRYCSMQEDLDKGAEGTGLAFIIFTQAINEFGPSAPFWSIVFFMMLLSLGLGSEFGTIEGVATSLHDLQPFAWMKRKWLLSGMLCLTSCMVGFLFVLGSGSYWVDLFDTFAGSFPLILIALAETVGVAYVYGMDRFANDLEFMIGHRPHWYWRMVWRFVAPVLIVTLMVSSLVINYSKPVTYKVYNIDTTMMEPSPYPWYAGVLAGLMVFSSILWMPAVAVLRKLGVLSYQHAKEARAQTHGHTASTTAFLASQRSFDDEADTGQNCDLDNGGPRSLAPIIDETLTAESLNSTPHPDFFLGDSESRV